MMDTSLWHKLLHSLTKRTLTVWLQDIMNIKNDEFERYPVIEKCENPCMCRCVYIGG